MIVNQLALLADPPIVEMERAKRKAHGTSYGLSEIGYDIRLKQSILFLPDENCVRVNDNGEHSSHLGNFILASAIEEFDMPTNLAGFVKDKSTWARHGLSVFNTVIEPGWKGFLTLELVYHGREMLHIPAGSGIAQVVFHRIIQPVGYEGKYQNQADKPIPAIMV